MANPSLLEITRNLIITTQVFREISPTFLNKLLGSIFPQIQTGIQVENDIEESCVKIKNNEHEKNGPFIKISYKTFNTKREIKIIQRNRE